MEATYFLDVDGALVTHGTNDLLPGAKELLEKIVESGGHIVFTTYRGDKYCKDHAIYCAESTQKFIDSLNIPYVAIVMDVRSPRILINDDGAAAINHKKNQSWTPKRIMEAVSPRVK